MSKKRSLTQWFFGGKDDEKFESIVNNTDEYMIQYLKDVQYDDVAFFHLNGYEAYAKIVSQYDGDTACLVFFLNGKIVKFRCRLSNIDCAEKKSNDVYERECAIKAMERVNEMVGDSGIVYARFKKFDKYGRLLVELFTTKESEYSINDTLVGEGLAYEYHGGKRVPFREWAHPSMYGEDVEGGVGYVIDNINDPEALEFHDECDPNTNISNK